MLLLEKMKKHDLLQEEIFRKRIGRSLEKLTKVILFLVELKSFHQSFLIFKENINTNNLIIIKFDYFFQKRFNSDYH